MFASNYGWKKEYLLARMTFPQVKLYLKAFIKRKEIEASEIDKAFGSTPMVQGNQTMPMKNSDLSGFGLKLRKKKKSNLE